MGTSGSAPLDTHDNIANVIVHCKCYRYRPGPSFKRNSNKNTYTFCRLWPSSRLRMSYTPEVRGQNSATKASLPPTQPLRNRVISRMPNFADFRGLCRSCPWCIQIRMKMNVSANPRNSGNRHLPAIACSRPCGASQALAAPDFTKLLHGIRLDNAE